MKYTQEQLERITDLGLNRIIAFDIAGFERNVWACDFQDSGDCYSGYKDSACYTTYDDEDNACNVYVNYCTNWEDIGPLMEEYKITTSPIQPTLPEHNKYLWCASYEHEGGTFEVWDENVKRGATIVAILIMQEDV